MTRYLRLLTLFIRTSLQNEAAYRADMFMRILVAVLQMGGELLGLWTIFANTSSLAGWNVYQVVVLLGVFRLMNGVIGMCIAPNMRLIMNDIRTGSLDFVLTKPIDSQFYASVRTFVVWRIPDILLGLMLIIGGASRLALGVGLLEAITFVLLLLAGSAIVYAFWLLLATSVFWFQRVNNIEMVFWNVFEAGRYPLDIYRPWVRWALTYIMPLAFLTTLPAGVITRHTTPLGAAAALIVAPVALLLATALWRYGLRHYSGASA